MPFVKQSKSSARGPTWGEVKNFAKKASKGWGFDYRDYSTPFRDEKAKRELNPLQKSGRPTTSPPKATAKATQKSGRPTTSPPKATAKAKPKSARPTTSRKSVTRSVAPSQQERRNESVAPSQQEKPKRKASKAKRSIY